LLPAQESISLICALVTIRIIKFYGKKAQSQ